MPFEVTTLVIQSVTCTRTHKMVIPCTTMRWIVIAVMYLSIRGTSPIYPSATLPIASPIFLWTTSVVLTWVELIVFVHAMILLTAPLC